MPNIIESPGFATDFDIHSSYQQSMNSAYTRTGCAFATGDNTPLSKDIPSLMDVWARFDYYDGGRYRWVLCYPNGNRNLGLCGTDDAGIYHFFGTSYAGKGSGNIDTVKVHWDVANDVAELYINGKLAAKKQDAGLGGTPITSVTMSPDGCGSGYAYSCNNWMSNIVISDRDVADDYIVQIESAGGNNIGLHLDGQGCITLPKELLAGRKAFSLSMDFATAQDTSDNRIYHQPCLIGVDTPGALSDDWHIDTKAGRLYLFDGMGANNGTYGASVQMDNGDAGYDTGIVVNDGKPHNAKLIDDGAKMTLIVDGTECAEHLAVKMDCQKDNGITIACSQPGERVYSEMTLYALTIYDGDGNAIAEYKPVSGDYERGLLYDSVGGYYASFDKKHITAVEGTVKTEHVKVNTDILRETVVTAAADADIVRTAMDGKACTTVADILRSTSVNDAADADIVYYACIEQSTSADIVRITAGARGFYAEANADIDYSWDGPGPVWHAEPHYPDGVTVAGDKWAYSNPGSKDYLPKPPADAVVDPPDDCPDDLLRTDRVALITLDDDTSLQYTHGGKGISVYNLPKDGNWNYIPTPGDEKQVHLSCYVYVPSKELRADFTIGFGYYSALFEVISPCCALNYVHWTSEGAHKQASYLGNSTNDAIANAVQTGAVNHIEISAWHLPNGNGLAHIEINGVVVYDGRYDVDDNCDIKYLYLDCGECYAYKDDHNTRRLARPDERVVLSDIVVTNCHGIPCKADADIARTIVDDNGRVVINADIIRNVGVGGEASVDIVRSVTGYASASADILREVFGGVSITNADIRRETMILDEGYGDILVRVPWDTTIYPVAPNRRHTDPFVMPTAEPQEGVQSIEIALNEMCLSDTFTLVTTQPIDISDQIRGRIVDFDYLYCAESTDQKDKLITVQGMYGSDNLLLRPIDIGVPRNEEAI